MRSLAFPSYFKPSQPATHNAILAEHEVEYGAGTCVKLENQKCQYTARHTHIAV
jgi:hypothetical protein